MRIGDWGVTSAAFAEIALELRVAPALEPLRRMRSEGVYLQEASD
jgi:hypothetical protein